MPNKKLRHIIVESNENKPFTVARDTTEIPASDAIKVIRIMKEFKSGSSIFDDFAQYEQKETSRIAKREKGYFNSGNYTMAASTQPTVMTFQNWSQSSTAGMGAGSS